MAQNTANRGARKTTRFPWFRINKRGAADAGNPAPPPEVLGAPSDFGVAVNNNSALKVTAYFAGIRLIAENIAALPRIVRYNGARGPEPAYDHPAYRLIAVAPNEYTNPFTFWSCVVWWVKGWGNAYALIKRDGAGVPVELHLLHPSWVRIVVVDGRKRYKVQAGNNDFAFLNGNYPDEDILHFMETTLDGIKGVNPIYYHAPALGKSLATEEFAAEFYRKGGNIRAVMEAEGNMTDEEYKTFMRHMRQSMGNYDTPLLEYGIKYKQLSVDPVAAQLVQSEVLSIQDICRILNVPPHMLAELSHATFSNIEHQTIQFVQYSLRPVIKRLEVELRSKLFFEDEIGHYDCEFVLDGLLRGDTTARSTYYHNAILDGYMSPNEVRALEGMTKVDGLDFYLRPANENVVGEEPENNKE